MGKHPIQGVPQLVPRVPWDSLQVSCEIGYIEFGINLWGFFPPSIQEDIEILVLKILEYSFT